MFQIHFAETVFAQSAKYMMVAKNDIQTKRSDVCSQWTSAPNFRNPIKIDSLDNLTIQACIVTMEKKLTIIGAFSITKQALKSHGNEYTAYEQMRDFIRIVQGKEMCIGRCKITIKMLINEIYSQKGRNSNIKMQFNDQFQLKSQSSKSQQEESHLTNQQKECQIKLYIHCGFNFYLNQAFKVSCKWGKCVEETRLIENRISPCWGEALALKGEHKKPIHINVTDSHNSVLQWLKIHPQKLKVMYPYHFCIKFRQEYMGAYPSIYISMMREDVPRYSILDRKVNLTLRYFGTAYKSINQYLLIYPQSTNNDNKLPPFIELDMRKYSSVDVINTMIEQSENVDYQWNRWNMLIPIKTDINDQSGSIRDSISMTILKSSLTRPLVCLYFSVEDYKALFAGGDWEQVKVIDRISNFESSLKQLYYNYRKIVVGKAIEISNSDVVNLEDERNAVSDQEKWKILTQNYILKQKLLDSSVEDIQLLKNKIRSKGEQLEQLKKVRQQVRKINTVMIEKQQAALVAQSRPQPIKIRDKYDEDSIITIVESLFQNCKQLQRHKQINEEMKERVESFEHFNQDTEKLDKAIVENSQNLLKQQQMLKQMNKIKQTLPKQRQVIAKMQKMFEEREVDKQMNDLLRRENIKLQQTKKRKHQNLENIYKIVKQHSSGPNSIIQTVQAAEKQLIRLSAEYAKLV